MSKPHRDIELTHWDLLRGGEADSLAWLYNRYFTLLYNYGKKLSADNKELEDAIHDLFVDLWRFRKNLSETTSVRFYLYRSLRRKLVRNQNQLTQALSANDFPEVPEMWVPSEEQDIIEHESSHTRVKHLNKLLDNLSPRQHEAMSLRFYDDMSFQEIGAILNVNEQSARNLVQRGLSQLRQFLKFKIENSKFKF